MKVSFQSQEQKFSPKTGRFLSILFWAWNKLLVDVWTVGQRSEKGQLTT